MNIPNFVNSQVVDENGKFTPAWSNLMIQLLTEMQNNLSNEGYKMPELPTTDIAKLTDPNISTARVVYDSSTNEYKGNVNGTWKTFTLV